MKYMGSKARIASHISQYINDIAFIKGITEYYLIFKQGFSAHTLHRMKKGEAISTKTLDALCYALDCNVDDIIRFEKE